MGKSYKTAKEYVFITLLGAISGSFIGEFLGNTFKALDFLGKNYFMGLKNPLVIDLKVLELTFGLGFGLNLMAIVGMVLAIVLFKRF